MKNLIKLIIKIIVGLLIFGFVVIPLALYFIIPVQGTKILKTPVKIRAVYFNPLMLNIKLVGLDVLDQKKQSILGFKSLEVDVSFIDLFKKKYRIEKLALDGFELKTILHADGHINLIDMVNNAVPKSSSTAATKESSPIEKKSQALPLIQADKITITNSTIYFDDQSISPSFSTKFHHINIAVDGFSTDPLAQTRVKFEAKLDDKGIITNEALLKPLAQPLELETTFTLNSYALTILSPYVGKYTGRALKNGQFDLSMTYRIRDNKLVANHKILVQHFEFGQAVQSKDALRLPYGLALALLEDPNGQIKITLPVKGDMSDPEFEYWHLVKQVITNFFTKLVTKPFTFLASMIGSSSEESSEELGAIQFSPGSFELVESEKNKLIALAQALKERPKLLLQINGSYDSEIDWKALKMEIFNNDYKILRADSARDDALIFRQLYQRRFGIRALWTLAKKHKVSMGKYEDDAFNKEMKQQLIENAPADRGALDVLGQGRAQAVYNHLISLGLAENRLNLGVSQAVTGGLERVPLEFTLTVSE
jgi:outer membrane protein OmpA-like peptidoglycan-associated protein